MNNNFIVGNIRDYLSALSEFSDVAIGNYDNILFNYLFNDRN